MKVPEFTIAIGPDAVVVAFASKVKLFPVALMPDPVLVLRSPLKVVVPVPAFCVMNRAVIACVETVAAALIVKPAMGVVEPMLPFSVMFPPPAVSVSALKGSYSACWPTPCVQ